MIWEAIKFGFNFCLGVFAGSCVICAATVASVVLLRWYNTHRHHKCRH